MILAESLPSKDYYCVCVCVWNSNVQNMSGCKWLMIKKKKQISEETSLSALRKRFEMWG